MAKKWCQRVLGPDQVRLLAHACVSVCRAYFRHWEWGGGNQNPVLPGFMVQLGEREGLGRGDRKKRMRLDL